MIQRRILSIAALTIALVGLSLGSQVSNTIHGAAQTMAATTAGTATTKQVLSDELLPADEDKALIRFAHAAPGAPTVDIFIDGSTLGSGLAFGDSVPYKALPAGAHHVVLEIAGKIAFETDITLPGKTAFTAVAQGLIEAKDNRAFTVAFYKENVSETNYRVRLSLIYAIPADLSSASDASSPVNFVALDLASGKVIDHLYKNLKFSEITPGFQLDKGSYRYALQDPADPQNMLVDFELTTETGMVYTAIATGYSGSPKTDLTMIVLSTKGLRYYPTAVPSTFASPALMSGMVATVTPTP